MTLPKLTRPRLANVHPRARLFALLDAARARPVVWVSGPPGAGKTTLVASYLHDRKLPGPWYQVDAGDADPATFFYYLREACAARRQPPLPLLTSEYLPDLAGFARRFFRSMFERLSCPSVCILDNFQEVSADSPLRAIIRDAATEVPEGISLVIISRAEPPAEFARLQASEAVAVIGWADLSLTLEETEAIVCLHDSGRESEASSLHERASAWAAGLTLLLGHPASAVALPVDDCAEVPQAVFDYLASEVFERAPPDLRHLWLRTAQLPRFTAAMAEVLSGNTGARRLLDRLCRERYFIERRSGKELTYQYHALFQEFLRGQMQRSYTAVECQRLSRLSAQQAQAQGEHGAALTLYGEVGDMESAKQLILQQAPMLFAQGRVHTLKEWIAGLPPSVVEETSWLLYWVGLCRTQAGDHAGSRDILAQVYERFARDQDLPGQRCAAAGVIEAYFLEWDQFGDVDKWIDALHALLVQEPPFSSPATELQVWASLLIASSCRSSYHSLASACLERVWQLCRSDLLPGEKLMGATLLTNCLILLEGGERTLGAIAEFSPLIRHPETTPMQRIAWYWSSMMHFAIVADFEKVRRLGSEAHAIAAQNGLSYILVTLRMLALWGRLPAGDLNGARQEIAEIAGQVDHTRPGNVGMYRFIRAWLALLEGHPRVALEHAEQAVSLARGMGKIDPIVASFSAYSQALAGCGELDRALAVAREATAWVSTSGHGPLRFTVLLFEAAVLLQIGQREESLAMLRDAFAVGRRSGHLNNIVWLPVMMSRLCAEALEAGIEVEYVKRLIQLRGLRAEGPETEHWPWSIKIYSLGRFSVVIDDEPLSFQGKTQKKPLELLNAMVAQGGRAVDTALLIEQLWPHLDGDAARNAFNLALHRLRKLLRHEDALRMRDGMLHLDSNHVWLDSRAFERLCATVERDRAQAPAVTELVATVQRLMRLYGGHFLAAEDAPWAIAARERLRSKFRRTVSALGCMLENAAGWEELTCLCKRAIELDPLAEEFHRALMTSYRAQGRVAEAMEAYRRCHVLLSRVFDVEPSEQTQTLYRSLAV